MRIELDEKKEEKESMVVSGGGPAGEKGAGYEPESLEDEIRLQRKKIKNMGFRQKLGYFVYYYKWHVIILILALAVLGSFLHSILTKKDIAFYCMFLDVDHALADTTEFSDAFEAFAGIDQSKYKAVFDTSISTKGDNPIFAEDAYDSVTRLNAMYMGAQVDAVCTDLDRIEEYALEENMIVDLSVLLDEDTVNKLREKELLYFDGKGIPVAVNLSGSRMLALSGCYDAGTELYACVMYNAQHREYFDDLIAFLGVADQEGI